MCVIQGDREKNGMKYRCGHYGSAATVEKAAQTNGLVQTFFVRHGLPTTQMTHNSDVHTSCYTQAITNTLYVQSEVNSSQESDRCVLLFAKKESSKYSMPCNHDAARNLLGIG